jgi:hypothetical protein
MRSFIVLYYIKNVLQALLENLIVNKSRLDLRKKVCKNSCQTRKKLIEMLTIISSGVQVTPIQVQQMFSDFGHYF